jgi:RNA polymerase sigma-70 factor, ECF subfamily
MGVQQPIPAAGCSEEFSNLVEQHMSVIFRFLLASLRDRDLAQTLTQGCFLKAHRSQTVFRGESSVRTGLMRIAINLQKDYWRNRRLRFWRETHAKAVDVDLVTDFLPSAERTPEAHLLAHEQAARVWTAVEALSTRERSVFLLRYVEELQLKDIGDCTGLKVGAVKVYLARARTKIRTTLKGDKRCG